MTNSLPVRRGFTRVFGGSRPASGTPALAGGPQESDGSGAPLRRGRRDREFLPAALEIIESPPSPIRLALIVAICALMGVALLWSWIGRIDIVAIAPGKLQPQGRVKTVQTVETGRITTIAGTDGVHVDRGQTLFTLDTAEAAADEAGFAVDLKSFRAEALRRAAAIAGARTGIVPRVDWPADMPAQVVVREDAVLVSDLGQFKANLANLRAQLNQKSAERQRLEITIRAQSALVATLKERVDMRSDLFSTGSGARSGVLDARENYETQAANLAYQIGQRGENEAAIDVAKSEMEKATQTFIADNDQKRAEAERQADDYDEKLAKANARIRNMTVVAPISGTVQSSTITTVGQVVNVGDEVMRIVPDGTRLEVEAYLPNRDSGFVHQGQEAVVKIDSFPFTRYGTVKGRVVRVASDAIPQPDADIAQAAPARATHDGSVGGGQHIRDLVFPVTISLDTDSIEADGSRVPLIPGMAVSAEVKTGNRRMLDYLFSPILEVSSVAMRER